MMKRKVFLAGMLAVLLALGLVLAGGCEGPTGSDGGNGNPVTTYVNNHIVTYIVGDGDGTAPEKKTVTDGAVINLPGDEGMMAPPDTIFDGWKDGGGTAYKPGKSYIVNANVIFTAQWKPVITVVEPTPQLPLRAVPVATSNSGMPVVVGSWTDGTYNYYLIDVGNISKIYISTILSGYWDGIHQVLGLKSTFNESLVIKSVTKTVSNSITISNTQTQTAGIEGAWKKKFPVAGEFSAKLNYKWTGSTTNLETNTESLETSHSTAATSAETNTTTITFGGPGAPIGNYRYALYANCKVYFAISTNLDNSSLLSWDTVVSAQDDPQPHMDYSADGVFDNSPEDGKTINLADDFYKKLPKPKNPLTAYTITYTLNGGTSNTNPESYTAASATITLSEPTRKDYAFGGWYYTNTDSAVSSIPTGSTGNKELYAKWIKVKSSSSVYDGDSIKNTEKAHTHTIYRPVGLDIDAIKALKSENNTRKYNNISIIMDIEIRAQDTGDGREIWLDINDSSVWKVSNLNVNWTSWKTVRYTHVVSIDKFTNSSEFRFGFNSKSYPFTDAIWFFNSGNISFEAVE